MVGAEVKKLRQRPEPPKAERSDLADILVAIDGSANSRRAAQLAGDLARRLGSRLTLVTVVEPPSVPRLERLDPITIPEYAGMIDSLRAASESAGRGLLNEIRDLVLRAGKVEIETKLEMGPVRQTLLRILSKLHPDLVVVGRRGLSRMQRLIVGSVSETIVRHAGCNVLVVR